MYRIITKKILEQYKEYLISEEKSIVTIRKYMRDIGKLKEYADGREITKELMIEYKI